ncbi:MAG: YIP1 family protein [Prevotellaceae bacterium]|jgi:hypothetical protein|nr:YIP1 family protein [Prevotellaceae bacterium]
MSIVERTKNILASPKTEWTAIEGENTPHVKLFTSYVLPLALIPAIAAFIGYGLIGYSVFGVRIHSMEWGIRQAIIQFIAMAGGTYITAFVINALAEGNAAVKNLDKAFALVAYSYTPIFLGGIFYLYPSLSWVASLAGIYGLYLLYIGLQPMMKSPAEKTQSYFIVSLIVTIVVFAILTFGLAAIVMGSGYGRLY